MSFFINSECLVILKEIGLIKSEIVLQFMLVRACNNASYTALLNHDADLLPVVFVTVGSDMNEGKIEVCFPFPTKI